jgi:hypothetical protein
LVVSAEDRHSGGRQVVWNPDRFFEGEVRVASKRAGFQLALRMAGMTECGTAAGILRLNP